MAATQGCPVGSTPVIAARRVSLRPLLADALPRAQASSSCAASWPVGTYAASSGTQAMGENFALDENLDEKSRPGYREARREREASITPEQRNFSCVPFGVRPLGVTNYIVEICRSLSRFVEICREFSRFVEIHRDLSRFIEICRESSRFVEICRDSVPPDGAVVRNARFARTADELRDRGVGPRQNLYES